MLVMLVSDYFKHTWKSKEKTNVSVVLFILVDPLCKPHLVLSLKKESIF